MKKVTKKEVKAEKSQKKSKFFLFIGVIGIIVLLLFFSTKIYLVVNMLLGNDIIVKLSSDKEILNLKHLESEKIKFEYYILTNPLCAAECSSEFKDLSKMKTIQKNSFILKPALTGSKEYRIIANRTEKAQEIYRFDISCHGISSFWCHTTEQNMTKSIVVTANYDLNDDEKELKESSRLKIEQMIQESASLSAQISAISPTLGNSSIEMNTTELDKIKKLYSDFNSSAYGLKERWENQEYDMFPPENAVFEIVPSELNVKLNNLNKSLAENISAYNDLVDNLTVLKQNLESLKELNFTNTTLIEMDNAIDSFNNAIDEFSRYSSIQKKSALLENISVPEISADENASLTSNKTIKEIPQKLTVISLQPSEIKIEFKELPEQCCLFGECSSCCENCSDKNYPVIFLHGHAFNRGISAEYSLETFQEMQQKLEEENYLNAGPMLISAEEQAGIWSKLNFPLTVRASYYFDLYKNPKESSIIQTKSDSLDTYAIRLRDIVSNVKYKAGKNKAIIISHSMGGLVVRRYAQLFGSRDIDRLILVGTPNGGIDSNIKKSCDIFGESLECRDMSEDSLLINQLKYEPLPDIPIYNIIGTGCAMANETGDGIVLRSNAYLEGARNYEISGPCDELKLSFLHQEMINPAKYLKVYQLILLSLKQ